MLPEGEIDYYTIAAVKGRSRGVLFVSFHTNTRANGDLEEFNILSVTASRFEDIKSRKSSMEKFNIEYKNNTEKVLIFLAVILRIFLMPPIIHSKQNC